MRSGPGPGVRSRQVPGPPGGSACSAGNSGATYFTAATLGTPRISAPPSDRSANYPVPARTWHAIAAAATTLSESTPAARAPGCIGMRTA